MRHSKAAFYCGVSPSAGNCCRADSSAVAVAAWLVHSVSDAESARVASRKDGASISGAVGMFPAYGTLGSRFAQRQHAWVLANAVV